MITIIMLSHKFQSFAFDAYGTLLDVHSAVAKHASRIGKDANAMSMLWRTKQLEYTWVRSLIPKYKDFNALTREALDFACSFYNITDKPLKADLLKAYETLDSYEEIASVLQHLKSLDKKIAIFSNGTDLMLQTALQAAHIDDLIDEVISVDDLGIYKTSPKAYNYCAQRLGCKPEEISFQSSNRWDIAGGKAFGFHTIWVNRNNMQDEYNDLSPDIISHDLRLLLDD